MKLPEKFEIELRNGVDIVGEKIHDKRTGVLFPFTTFNENERYVLRKILDKSFSKELLDLKRKNKMNDVEQWKKYLSKLNEMNFFYIKTSSKTLNLFLNQYIIYHKNKLYMLMKVTFSLIALLSPFILCVYYGSNYSQQFGLFSDYCFYFMIYIISVFMHEISHCIIFWVLNEGNENGYILFDRYSLIFVAKTIDPVKDAIVSLSGPIIGAGFALCSIFIYGSSLPLLLIILYHILQLSPFFPDGKIILGGIINERK